MKKIKLVSGTAYGGSDLCIRRDGEGLHGVSAKNRKGKNS